MLDLTKADLSPDMKGTHALLYNSYGIPYNETYYQHTSYYLRAIK